MGDSGMCTEVEQGGMSVCDKVYGYGEGVFFVFFFQAEDGIRDAQESRGLGDVYKRQDPRSALRS